MDTHVQEKPLSIALREINEDLLTCEDIDPAELAAEEAAAKAAAADAGDRERVSRDPVELHRTEAASPGGAGRGSSSVSAAGSAAYKACERLRRFTESGHEVTGRADGRGAASSSARRPGRRCPASPSASRRAGPPSTRCRTCGSGRSADLRRGRARAPRTSWPRPAHGLADDLLTNTLLTARCPVVFAPGHAHRDVGAPGHQGQRRTLRGRGARGDRARRRAAHRRRHRQGPAARAGRDLRACAAAAVRGGLDGPTVGRAARAGRHASRAGGTREYLDPVRFLGNRSSGQQGYALARAAAARGAEVTLVAANVALPDPAGAWSGGVETTAPGLRRRSSPPRPRPTPS